jgi:hypothetical protein
MSSKITLKQLGHLNAKKLRNLRRKNRKAIQKLGYIPDAYLNK